MSVRECIHNIHTPHRKKVRLGWLVCILTFDSVFVCCDCARAPFTTLHPGWLMVRFPGSRYLCSGGRDQLVKVWDLKTQRLIRKFESHTGVVSSVAFNRKVACAVLLVHRNHTTSSWCCCCLLYTSDAADE